ncbi:MAG: hypothetical protein K9N09_04010 [Candidatus Cloacimonetes bacterium]|nr:hypothetical protein [Candidatus Cloacimonadota bacterium]MCF7813354.1 hypothetical protein [Candidatus Cloacimonadota bacterium]MCF7867843.1 hypothetical protein [Candidatus Cloacimonadota bacterium]MCF7883271.1 hypothetical protein [Candidatus Cloacimonadota bacterium]
MLTKKPKNLTQIYSQLEPEIILKSIIKFARISKYEIDHFDEENNIIILSKAIGFFDYGFFFPIYISIENSRTLIEIGIKSKVLQLGPIPERTLERFVTGIKTSLYLKERE